MTQYYEWDNKKDKFVKVRKLCRRRNLKIKYKLAKNSDKIEILKFEIDCVKSEPDIYLHLPDFKDFKKKLKLIDFNQTKDFAVAIALLNNKVVGLLSMSWYFNYDTKCKIGLITDIWVLKPYRIAGVGTGLINFAKKTFKALAIKRIELIVGLKNLAAKRFYKKLGFKIRKVGQAILEF